MFTSDEARVLAKVRNNLNNVLPSVTDQSARATLLSCIQEVGAIVDALCVEEIEAEAGDEVSPDFDLDKEI